MKFYFFSAVVLLGFLTFSTPTLAQTTWVVDHAGSGNFLTIQEGIDAASNGDLVLVRPGIYFENLNFSGKLVHVRSDGDGDPGTYDLSPAITIIDGNGTGSVVTFESGEDETAALEGFTIRNGRGTYVEFSPGYWSFCGAGVLCENSSPTIRNCDITGNLADVFEGDGGGVCCLFASPTITDCTITDNATSPYFASQWSYHGSGGGIYCRESSPVISNCTISGNKARSGGGIYSPASSSPTVTGCTITENEAYSDGLQAGVGSMSPCQVKLSP
ncbi:MAG: right-handed parallel beta-helix repeat-containing protein [bacterium]